jgi:DNA polymerase-3 subunit gamma/tau
MWAQVLAAARKRKVVTEALLSEHASVLDVRANEVFLGFSAPAIARMFGQSNHIDVLCAALAEQFGGTWRVTIGEPGAGGGRGGAPRGGGAPGRPPVAASTGFSPPGGRSGLPTPAGPPASGGSPGQASQPGLGSQPAGFGPGTGQAPAAQTAPPPPRTAAPVGPVGPVAAAAGAALATATRGPLGPGLGSGPAAAAFAPISAPAVGAASGQGLGTPGGMAADPAPGYYDLVDEPSLDDEDAPSHPGATLGGEAAAMELLRSGLGATVIEERPTG